MSISIAGASNFLKKNFFFPLLGVQFKLYLMHWIMIDIIKQIHSNIHIHLILCFYFFVSSFFLLVVSRIIPLELCGTEFVWLHLRASPFFYCCGEILTIFIIYLLYNINIFVSHSLCLLRLRFFYFTSNAFWLHKSTT